MNKRSFGKLQLNRETLRNLNTGELQQVVGGIGTQLEGCTDGCYGNSNASDCRFACPQTASCDCTSIGSDTCQSGIDCSAFCNPTSRC